MARLASGARGFLMAVDEAQISLAHPPKCLRALRAVELLLHLIAWVGIIASIILDGRADGFDPKRIIGEGRHYDWHHTTGDAVLAAFIFGIIAGIAALNKRPIFGLVASLLVCGARRTDVGSAAGVPVPLPSVLPSLVLALVSAP